MFYSSHVKDIAPIPYANKVGSSLSVSIMSWFDGVFEEAAWELLIRCFEHFVYLYSFADIRGWSYATCCLTRASSLKFGK